MRRLLWVLISILLLTPMSACNRKNVNVLNPTKLTDREKAFLAVGNNQYFAFDYNVDDKYKWFEVWIDSYEFGREVSRSGTIVGDLSKKEGIVLATLNEFEKKEHDWTIAVINSSGYSSIKFNEKYDERYNPLSSKISGINTSKNISINENEITLASVCYIGPNNDTAAFSLTNEFYSNPDENIKEIEKYDLVYFLKVKFYEENPNK